MGRFIGWSSGGTERGSADGVSSAGAGDAMCSALPVSAERLRQLMQTIEGEIIPRLVLAHRDHAPRVDCERSAVSLTSDHLARFTERLLDDDLDAPRRFVEALQEDGVALDCIYLELFSPAARRLGEMWSADLCDFTAVTLGLWRLQRLLYDFGPSFQFDADLPSDGRRILLVPMPGEQHTFGLFMVAEFFRRAGWDVMDGPMLSAADITRAVSHNWFELLGLSLSCDRGLDAMASLIREVRRTSRNQGIGIIVGGSVFIEHPDAVLRVDADLAATDARQAVVAAEDLLFAKPRQQRAAGQS